MRDVEKTVYVPGSSSKKKSSLSSLNGVSLCRQELSPGHGRPCRANLLSLENPSSSQLFPHKTFFLLSFLFSAFLSGFTFPTISAAATFSLPLSPFYGHLFSTPLLLQPPFSVLLLLQPLFCPTPFAASKSEVDSLWPLRM